MCDTCERESSSVSSLKECLSGSASSLSECVEEGERGREGERDRGRYGERAGGGESREVMLQCDSQSNPNSDCI